MPHFLGPARLCLADKRPEGMANTDRIGELAIRIARVAALNELLMQVSDWVCQALNTPDCVIYLPMIDDETQLVQSAAWGQKNPSALPQVDDPLALRVGQGVVGAAAATGISQIVVDTRTDPRHIADVGSGISELAVPIISQGEVIGVIDTEHPEPGHYDENARLLVEQVAAVVAGQVRAAVAVAKLQASLAAEEAMGMSLREAVLTDALTCLANRRCLDGSIAQRHANGEVFWACVLDLDGFKRINDVHGHGAGDEVLVAVAQLLADRLGQDPTSLIARTGGDEFVVLTAMPVNDLRTAMESLLDEITWCTSHLGHISASIGVASGRDAATVHRADDAMAIAKELGGNRVVHHAEASGRIARLAELRAWRDRAKTLLASDGLHLVYQPIMPLDSGDHSAPLALEALVRLPDGEHTSTARFVDALSRYRLDVDLDRRTLGEVLDVLQVQNDVSIAHNWSARSFDSEQGLVWELLDELHRRQIDPTRLIVEVTEHVAIEAPDRFQVALRCLRREGVRVALDDLGAGWSSFRFLNESPVDILKLDGDWTQQAHVNPIAHELIQATLRCASITGATVVAEWIETPEQRDTMLELGVQWGQGYWLQPPAELTALGGPSGVICGDPAA